MPLLLNLGGTLFFDNKVVKIATQKIVKKEAIRVGRPTIL